MWLSAPNNRLIINKRRGTKLQSINEAFDCPDYQRSKAHANGRERLRFDPDSQVKVSKFH